MNIEFNEKNYEAITKRNGIFLKKIAFLQISREIILSMIFSLSIFLHHFNLHHLVKYS